MRPTTIFSATATLGVALSQEVYLGFNAGATTDEGEVKNQEDFENEFRAAQQMQGSPGVFGSFRLYTNVQQGTTDSPYEAFPAAIATNTSLLLGIWCSGTTSIENELNALTSAIDQYGNSFTDLIVGLSVGSEDLYRVSKDGISNDAGIGQEAETIIGFIRDARDRLRDTPLANIPIGHVDAWSAWVNESNSDVINECDFIGTNIFPYFESDEQNEFSNASFIFNWILNETETAAGDKPVWITETGWPSEGPDFGAAVASTENAQGYWNEVGCSIFGRRNTWWYILQDANPENDAKFAITDDLSTTAKWNLTCPASSGAPAAVNNNPGSNSSAALSTPLSWAHTVVLCLSLASAVVAWVA